MIKLTTILLILTTVVPALIYFRNKSSVAGRKAALFTNIGMFAVSLAIMIVCLADGGVMAAGETAAAAGNASGWGYIAAALTTGFSTIGSGIAVAASASAALGALSENEGVFGKALIFVALAEGIALYGVLVSVLILNKI